MAVMRSLRPLALAVVSVAVSTAAIAGLAAAGPDQGQVPPTSRSADSSTAAGRALYEVSCATCHGPEGGGTSNGPTLIGVGAAAADFQLSTGRMPYAGARGAQAQRKPPAFDQEQIDALVAYVASLGSGPPIPQVNTSDGLIPRGQQVFIDNCAPCHGATANGGAVGGGALAPPLDQATPRQIGEALASGPGQMPVFHLPEQDVNAVASYVQYLQTAPQPGGLSIGGIGPVPEGFVAWVLGLGLLIVVIYLIGREWDRSGEQQS